ncbi:MarC family protein [Nostoc sp. PA-18-2419]|uniref:MarC family protein n=1 Tax=Nostoc sp. PA-18-2419 TaxID=2575443 RepID=UPI001CB95FB9|nr:MarC family protein [Nostoc sp. PA-18-2419]
MVVLVLTKGITPEETSKVIDKLIIVAIALILLFDFTVQVILNYLKISIRFLQVSEDYYC